LTFTPTRSTSTSALTPSIDGTQGTARPLAAVDGIAVYTTAITRSASARPFTRRPVPWASKASSRNASMPLMLLAIAGTARHSAYRSQFVVVTYPWHPLHGQRVRVYGRQRRAGRQILYIEVQPGLSREIPAWMCDAAVCATISSGPPRIAVAALTELRAVLDLCSTGRQSDRSLTPMMTKGGSNETSLDQSTRSRSRSRRHDHVVGTGARRTAAGARRAAPPSSRQANQGDPDPTGNM
jgi:hypothetical protein